MRSSSSLLGRGLFWIASEMLEILTKIFRRIFNLLPLTFYLLPFTFNLLPLTNNLNTPCVPCVPWIKKIRGIRVQIFLKPDRLDLWCIE